MAHELIESRNQEPVRISVILPTVAMDEWLEAAFDSIATQHGAPAYEIILVQDGCTGPAPSSHGVPLTVLRSKERQGLSNALRAAVIAAKGYYIARIDADDLALPGRLAAQYEYLESHPEVAVLTSRALYMDAQGVTLGSSPIYEDPDVTKTMLVRNPVIHPGVMFRRPVAIEAGNYRRDMRKLEDYELWLRMARLGQVHAINDVGVHYRLHQNQMSRHLDLKASYMRLISRQRWLLSRHLGTPRLPQATREALWWGAQSLNALGLRRAGHDPARLQ